MTVKRSDWKMSNLQFSDWQLSGLAFVRLAIVRTVNCPVWHLSVCQISVSLFSPLCCIKEVLEDEKLTYTDTNLCIIIYFIMFLQDLCQVISLT